MSHPPRLARLVGLLCLPRDAREVLIGDLDEEFSVHVLPSRGRSAAARWYWSQVARAIWAVFRAPRNRRGRPLSRKGEAMVTWFYHFRYAVRTLVRSPGFTILVVVTLALGIGANAAIFSAVNDVLLRKLTFTNPDRLYLLWEANVERGWSATQAAPANIEDWQERVPAFDGIGYLSGFLSGMALTGRGEPVRVSVDRVSANLFDVLGVRPVRGRLFRANEDWATADPVVLLSFGAWQRHFGGNDAVVGSTIRLDGLAYLVVGVLEAGFRYEFADAEMWTTFRWTDARRESIWWRQAHVVRPIGRLRSDFTAEQASTALSGVAKQLQREHPELNRGMEAGMTPLHDFLVGDQRRPLLLLLGAVGLLQLIACANVANLFLVRGVSRRREIAVRSALGADRGHIVRQFLAESVVLAFVGAIMGVALGFGAAAWMTALRPPEIPDWTFRLNGRFAAFTGVLTLASALLFGLWPAFRSANGNAGSALAEGGRTGTVGRRGHHVASFLVAGELALALLLVIGAGLMIRTMRQLQEVDAGVDPTNVLTFALSPSTGNYPRDSDRAQFTLDLLDRLGGEPDIMEIGAIRALPFSGGGWTSDFAIEGWSVDQFGTEVKHREATSGYFAAMSVPLLRGTMLTDRWTGSGPVPVMVNRAFVERYFADESPIGRRITFDRTPDENSFWYTIVGVVGNERNTVAADPRPEVIAPLYADTPRTLRFAVKTNVPPMGVVSRIRAIVRELDPDLPLEEVATMNSLSAEALASQRFVMTMLSVFAGLALTLACVGVYGVASQVTRSQTRNVGIRVALGATDRQIVGHFLGRGTIVLGGGLSVGLVAALLGAKVMRGFLFGVAPVDPITFASVPVVLALVFTIANWIPARRAARVDPVIVLRSD